MAGKKKNQISTEKPKTSGYRSLINHHYFQAPRDLPPFNFAIIRMMLIDPQVKLNLGTRAGPIHGVEFGYKEGQNFIHGVKCKREDVAKFVLEELTKIWEQFLPQILKAQIWGWSAGEVIFEKNEDDLIVIKDMQPKHAGDVRLLTDQDGEGVGISVNRVKNDEAKGQRIPLMFPHCWFHAYDAEEGERYGTSVLLGAYSPWADKWLNGGALDVRRLFMHKDAYGGVDIAYPPGTTPVGSEGEEVDNYDIARQMAEQVRAGGVTTRPSTRDENGNMEWEITRATVPASPQHILQYPKDCDAEIRSGMEIPDGINDDDGTGGGWAGKRIPLMSFYSSLDTWVVQIIRDMVTQILKPMVKDNFGDVTFHVSHKPLAEQAMEQQSNAGGGQQPMRDGDNDGVVGEGYPGFRMSLQEAAQVVRATEGLLDA